MIMMVTLAETPIIVSAFFVSICAYFFRSPFYQRRCGDRPNEFCALRNVAAAGPRARLGARNAAALNSSVCVCVCATRASAINPHKQRARTRKHMLNIVCILLFIIRCKSRAAFGAEEGEKPASQANQTK